MICITDEVKTKIAEYVSRIKDETYTHRPKEKKMRSNVWKVFHEIIDDMGNVIENFYYCPQCETVEYSHSYYSTVLQHSF